jgi:hypothetical protein
MFHLSQVLWCGKIGFFFFLFSMPTIISASANYGGVEHCQISFLWQTKTSAPTKYGGAENFEFFFI